MRLEKPPGVTDIMIMKRSLIALLSLLLFTFAGCSNMGLGGSRSPVADRVRANGEIRVGMSGNQPPFNMTSRSGAQMGMEVDLVRGLARALGVREKIVTMPFQDLLPALQKGEVDIVLSGLTMTPARNLEVAFAGPYFISGKAALTKSDSLAAADEPSDVNKPIRMTVLAGSTSEQFVQRDLPEVELVPATDYDEAIRMVLDDEVDAMIADYPICILALYQHPNAGLATTISPFTFEPIGAALSSDAPLLTNLVSNYLTLLEGTGTLEQLRAIWFNNDAWVRELP
jgi:polar amino acid transport system substrate-binding protein